ncbi:MaoC/PaaZ C-terminal domain-containing protein [Marinomonas sp. 15G1-11]|uniref:MaoC/PaaZ C-terminal domain-containing protein n=1 Tax=Marinomonas phaeophyticola TaxID=3004091 RepID=A0ABT4JXB4_9GAMM|nr:MaoC/PaaZ C-terminal domain-containing protein [Marinomonas sp. 15G1-11]MCZ2722959.1 MaoC/PaaZ C-terminal domain-containing protein [Marinomonas sp. 15G1-11]
MSLTKFFEDYHLNYERTSTGRTITDADIVLHAGQTGDFYPHHMDEDWCKTQPFGSRIAHGTLTFSVGIGLGAGELNPEAMTYGYERLRFPNPVFINDTLKTTITIVNKYDHEKSPNTKGIVVERVITRKGNGDVVLVCDHLLLVNKNNPQDTL